MSSTVKGQMLSDVRLSGKVVVITGCNQGIGYETAFDLAGRGAKIVMACRDLEKAEVAKKQVSLNTGWQLYPADNQIFESVHLTKSLAIARVVFFSSKVGSNYIFKMYNFVFMF